MTSIGEQQEKDEEIDEGNDISNDVMQLNNNDSNMSNKFMTIQVGSEYDQQEQPTRHDVNHNSTSFNEQSKLSTLNPGSDRVKINSRGNIHMN